MIGLYVYLRILLLIAGLTLTIVFVIRFQNAKRRIAELVGAIEKHKAYKFERTYFDNMYIKEVDEELYKVLKE